MLNTTLSTPLCVSLKCVKYSSLTTGYCIKTNLDTVITTNVSSCAVLLFVDEKMSSLNEQFLHGSVCNLIKNNVFNNNVIF